MKKLFLAIMACAGLCACSSDDIDLGNTQKVFQSDVAYMKVNFSEVGSSGTRAFSSGYSDEDKVDNAYFYFYDEQGNFITKGEITDFKWSGGDATSSQNVEEYSGNVVILEGLTDKSYPKYVVTVLNQPDNFIPGTTLDRMEGMYAGGIYDNAATPNFIMSTSSYLGASDDYSFVTELSDENDFTTSLQEAIEKEDAVEIYVERLAAKVTLSVSGNIDNVDDGYYKLSETIGGEENNEEEGEAVTDIYVKILGWELNATAKNSYMMKNLDPNWADNAPWDGWNDNDNHRSYWCKSFNYGQEETDDYLQYNNLSADNLNDLDATEYCPENTNSVYISGTTGIIKSKYSPAITSILVKAQAYTKADDEYTAISLIRYKGLLFDEEGFLNAISIEKGVYDEEGNPIGSETGLTLSTTTVDGNTTVSITLATGTYYDEKGEVITETPSFEDIEEFSYYSNGLMYYTIPIEHLNNSGELAEGYYGVVRNHSYKVTINSLANIGKAVANENDTIIPDEDDVDEVNYYLPATIHILSWNEVTQGADL